MEKIIILILLPAFIFIIGCGQKKTENTSSGDNKTSTPTTENKTESGPLALSQKEFVKSYNNCKPSDTCTYFKVVYLEATYGKIKDKLNKFINTELLYGTEIGDSLPASMQAAADSFMVSYMETKKQFPNIPGSWFWEYTMKIYNETEKVLTLTSESSTFTGGAHPNWYAGFYNISKETGDTLSLKDFLVPGFETKLNALIDKKYREMKGLKPGDNLQEKGDLFENKITFNYNVAVSKEGGLVFYYNPYEIAPYAAGPIKITLTTAELGDLIGPNSPIK
jgi:hypothetical protein